MIDWLTIKVPLWHEKKIHSGHVVATDYTGELQYQTTKRFTVKGSHDQQIQIRSTDYIEAGPARAAGWPGLELTGNPLKYLQGHNIFGSNDLVGLVTEVMLRICSDLGIPYTDEDFQFWITGNFTISRVDCTENFRLNRLSDVLSWLRSAASCSRMRNVGNGQLTKESTLYFGKQSRRRSLKFYAKGDELKAHKLPASLSETSLLEYAQPLLRAESCYRGTELSERGLKYGYNWDDNTANELLNAMIDNLEISEMNIQADDKIDELPSRLCGVYALWKQGHDLRQVYARRTFYRYRSQLLKHGIDIAIVQDRDTSLDNVVPLVRVLEAVPEPVPSWAVGTDLYFEPRHFKTR